MKGRLFVVNNDFIKNIDSAMCVEALIPEPKNNENKFKQNWYKTLTDIMADMFQMQIGDYVFFWETKGNNPDSYILGVYRIISNPFFEDNMFKAKIEPAYIFKNPITEYDILNDPYNKIDLWNIVGKKIAGKSRASTPLSPYEIEFLIQKLIDANPSFEYIPYENKVSKCNNEIKVDFSNTSNNTQLDSLSQLNIDNISYINPNGTAKYEKFLELIFNYSIKNNDKELFKILDINLDNVFWYANYLPYSIERKEIDYLIMESSDKVNVNKIDLIEFQKGTLNKDHINKCLLYSKWINYKLAKGTNLTRPIIICEQFRDLENYICSAEKTYGTNSLEIYTINFKDGITIEKRR